MAVFFFCQILYDEFTAIPLSSGIPGITIESEPVSGNFSLVRYNMAVEKLTIGPEMYDFLQVLYTVIIILQSYKKS